MKTPQKLIVAILSLVDIVEVNNTTDNRLEITGGLAGLFLKDVLAALAIDYELVHPPDGQYGRMTRNGSWTGLLGMIMRGDSDIGCCPNIMSEKRRKAVEFSIPYGYEQIIFVIKKPEQIHLQNGYLYPFHLSVWVCYLLMLIVMSSVLWIFLERRYSIERIAFELIGSTLRQPFVLYGNLWMAKFLLAIFCVCALVMTSAYSGVLLSFLTVSAQGETVETFQQLSAGVMKGTHKCYVFGETFIVPYLLGSQEKHLQLLGKAVSRNKWYLDSRDKDAFKKLSSNAAIIMSRYQIDIITQGTSEQQSKLIISNDILFTALVSIPMNHNFCCRKKLDDIILRFGTAGMMQKYVREAAFRKYQSTPKLKEKIDKNHKISVDDITGALLVLCTGYALSFITLLAEILISKYNVYHLGL